MRTIGLIGGMSWQSTITYYRHFNEAVHRRLGGLHSARLQLCSVDFGEIARLQRAGDWTEAGRQLAEAARSLERAGADMVLIGANTMHKVADAVAAAIRIPLVHIVDATVLAMGQTGVQRALLLGTRYTMEEDFLVGRYRAAGIDVRVPDEAERVRVHQIIFDELCQGTFRAESRQGLLALCEKWAGDVGGGIILGCTELSLVVQPDDLSVPVFDTTQIHAERAVELAFS